MNLAWKIEFEDMAKKELSRLDRQVQSKIYRFLQDRIAKSENPRDYGDPLRRNLFGFWKYRVGDYRVICEIRDEMLVVLVVRIGHRRSVYKDAN